MVFATLSARPSSRSQGYVADLALLLVGGGALLMALILWLDNAQGGVTGNGVFKTIELAPWISDPANAPAFPSNYFFYPVYGAGCRLLDLLGVFAGDPRRQLTILNAASASVCLGMVYLLVRHITGDRLVALAATFFHIACNDVLFLAIINEDIMPSYTVMFASMALAGAWFARPSALRVAAVSVLFSIGWLFEWRLMFPTLPAMVLALWLCENRLGRRLAWIALFLAAMVAMAGLAAWLMRGHEHAVGPLELLWTGKAVASAWSGFSALKAYYLTDGLAGYLMGTGLASIAHFPGWDVWRIGAIACEAAIGGAALAVLWRARADRRAWSLAAVFGGTFVAGEVFNLYAQPSDPQMQINVMAWLTVGWALALGAAQARWGARGLVVLSGLAVALLAYNLWSLAPVRGLDGAWKQAIGRLEHRADPARTVFLIHDFDWASTYAAASWGKVEPEIDDLGPAPQARRKFKRIGAIGGILVHPARTDQEQVDALRHQIDRALELGYDVVALRLWDRDQYFLDQLSATVVRPALMQALTAMLHRDYTATAIMDDPVLGKVYRLQKAPGR